MRFIVLVLALLAAGAAAFFGLPWLVAFSTTSEEIAKEVSKQPSFKLAERVDLERALPRARASGIFLMVAAPLALLAGVLALMRRGKSAAALLLLAIVGPLVPAVLLIAGSDTGAGVLVGTAAILLAALPCGLLFLGGLLAFFVGPPREAPARRARDEDEGEDEDDED
jgi:hypothetical protein